MHNESAKSTGQDTQPDSLTASHQECPNGFNLRAEAAEQQEIVQNAITWYPAQTPALTCSEYDF